MFPIFLAISMAVVIGRVFSHLRRVRLLKQIHRSTIVNMKAVAGVTRDDSGRGTLRLKNSGETLPVSLSYMTLFKSM